MRHPTPSRRHCRSVIAFDLRPLAGVPLPHSFVDCLPFAVRRLMGRLRPRWRHGVVLAQSLAAVWRRRRAAATAYRELRSVDARTLHDLGLHDSELWSVVTEIHGDADPTRMRTLQARRGPE